MNINVDIVGRFPDCYGHWVYPYQLHEPRALVQRSV